MTYRTSTGSIGKKMQFMREERNTGWILIFALVMHAAKNGIFDPSIPLI